MLALHKPLLINRVVLEQDAQRIERDRNNPVVRAAEQFLQPDDQFIQLLGMQIKCQLAQIVGDVFRELVFADLQPFGKLDRDLVALVEREQRHDPKQRGAGVMPDNHPFTDFNQVGKVGRNVQDMFPLSMGELVEQHLDVDRLDNPGGGRLEVVQIDVTEHILAVKDLLLHTGAEAEALQGLILQKQHRYILLAVQPTDHLPEHSYAGMFPVERRRKLGEEPHCRRGQADFPIQLEEIACKCDQPFDQFRAAKGMRKIKHGIEQRKGGPVIVPLRIVVIPGKPPQKDRCVVLPAGVQR